MISAKFLCRNVLLGGKLQKGAKNSNFEIFESALYMKSVSMSLRPGGRVGTHMLRHTGMCCPNGLLFRQKSLDMGPILVKKSLEEGPISHILQKNCKISHF